jgi:hypothetical protein
VLVGTGITVVASLAPASKATRVAPVEALRESVPGGYRFSPRRAVAGAVVTAGGLAALGAGLFGGAALAVVGLGAAITFLGITVLLPLLSRGLARLLGAPLPRLAGMTGKLARDNAMRNPKRTASTAAALMVGLALVASVSVLASSLKASLGSDIERTLQSELVLQQAERGGLSPDVARAVRGTEGVQAVSELGWAQAKVEGALTGIAPVDPITVEQVIDLGLRSGEVSALRGATVLVHEGVAEDRGWSVGDDVAVEWPQTGETTLRVAGVFSEKDAVSADYLVSLDTFDENATGRLDVMVLLKTAGGHRRVRGAGRRSRRRRAVPRHAGADRRGADGVDRRRGRPADDAHDGHAAAGGGHRADGDRQHAGPVGVRADPGDRAPARGRHDPHAGPPDGALGVGHHRRHRRCHGISGRPGLRRRLRDGARGAGGVRALGARSLAWRCTWPQQPWRACSPPSVRPGARPTSMSSGRWSPTESRRREGRSHRGRPFRVLSVPSAIPPRAGR